MPELITKAWKCSFCNRCFVNRGVAKNHESACKRNPERRHCATCIYGMMRDEEIEITKPLTIESYLPGYKATTVTYRGPWCAYHEQPISEKPYYIECDMSDDPYYEEQPIPGTCLNYEYKGYFGWTPEKEYREAVARGKIEANNDR